MLGVIIIVAVLVVIVPVAFLMSGALASAALGWLLKDEADRKYEGTELIELS